MKPHETKQELHNSIVSPWSSNVITWFWWSATSIRYLQGKIIAAILLHTDTSFEQMTYKIKEGKPKTSTCKWPFYLHFHWKIMPKPLMNDHWHRQDSHKPINVKDSREEAPRKQQGCKWYNMVYLPKGLMCIQEGPNVHIIHEKKIVFQ